MPVSLELFVLLCFNHYFVKSAIEVIKLNGADVN